MTGEPSGSAEASPPEGAAARVAAAGERLRDLGLEAGAWSNGAGDRYAAHAHGYDKVLACERGSIRFGLPDRGEAVDLAAGDRLDLPAGTRHDAVVGPEGVTCLEAHVPAGSLGGLRRYPAGTW